MTQVSNVQQTAAFARRVVCRALTVVGGVAAGTALAWWLSTSSASAEIEAPEAPAVVQEVAAPVTQAVDATAQRLQDPPPPPKAALDDLGQQVTDAANKFRARTDLPKLPSCDNTVCLDNERHMYPFDSFGRSDLPSTPAPAPAATTVVPGVVVDALVPSTATERAFADGMSRRGSPKSVSPALPELPNWPAPLPFAPAGPTTVNHGSAGNSSDSHLFAALPWQDRDVDLVAGGIATPASSAAFGRVGAQPGVAPD